MGNKIIKKMKLIVAALALSSAHKLERRPVGGYEKTLIQINLDSNDDLMNVVNQGLNNVKNLVEVKKLEEACDDECKKKCDDDADKEVRKLQNPLINLTWNCKNNYDVYTTDYDPDHSHFDRISNDVMD